jgi:hypothetical protein
MVPQDSEKLSKLLEDVWYMAALMVIKCILLILVVDFPLAIFLKVQSMCLKQLKMILLVIELLLSQEDICHQDVSMLRLELWVREQKMVNHVSI